MRLPKLHDIVELNDELGLEDLKVVVNRWFLTRSLPFKNVVIKPIVNSFNETPKIIINEDLTVDVKGFWIFRDGNNSKVFLRGGDALSFNCEVFTLNNNSLLKLCNDGVLLLNLDSGDEEVLIEGYRGTEIKHLNNSSILVRGNRKDFLIFPHMKNKVLEVQDFLYAESNTTVLAVFKHKRKYYVSIGFRFLDLNKIYELDKCVSVKEVTVGDGLGIVRCSDSNYLVSINEVLRIPFFVEPLAYVDNEYILYDNTFGVIIRFDGRNFNQLLIPSKPKVIGRLRSGELIVISNGYPYIITDNVWKIISNSRVLSGITGDDYIVLRGIKSLELYKRTSYISSYRPLECTLINENLICLSNSNALIYDLRELHEADISIKQDNLTITNYPTLLVTPWHINSQILLKGPVILLPNQTKTVEDFKTFVVKPLFLGRELTFKVMHDLPLTQITKEFKIKTEKVELKELTMKEVKHSSNGFIKGTEENTLIHMYLKVFNPTPEEIQLLIKYITNESGGSKILKQTHQNLRPGINELSIADTLKTNSNSLQVLVEYNWLNKVERLAIFTVDLNKYLIEDPIIDLDYRVEVLDECRSKLVISSETTNATKIPICLTITCSDGKVFRGTDEVLLSECSLPAIIEYNYGYDIYNWRRYHVIRDEALVNINIVNSDEYGVKAYERKKCIDGFVLKDVDLNLKIPNSVMRLNIEPIIHNGVKLKISYKLFIEGMTYVFVGDKAASLRGSEGVIEVEVDDPVNRDLKILILSGGTRNLYVIDNVDLIRKYFELGINAATLLKGKLSIREDYGD
ncbi:MAG: hypothetical protein QXO98_03025 [Sulfolobales archaeon]